MFRSSLAEPGAEPLIPALVDLLGSYWQAGDLAQVEVVARSLLASIPDDLVALQFLGLVQYRRGHHESALRLFRRAAAAPIPGRVAGAAAGLETASELAYREATRPGSLLAEGWREIAELLARHGLRQPARAARLAAFRARAPAIERG